MTLFELYLTAALIVVAYLLGAIPFSYIVARACGVDLRTVGSGNVGGANVWRSCGFGPFIVAAALDMSKGFVPTFVALRLLPGRPFAVVLVGIAAMIGHTLPIFLNFKGGKAVATSCGVLLAIFPLLVPFGIAAWAIAFLITRISSVGSLTAAAAVLVTATVFYLIGQMPLAYALFVWAMGAFVIYMHRTNIQRLLAGTESRFGKLF
jgi:glycerol-3-phosphate acyltransferase PlsY